MEPSVLKFTGHFATSTRLSKSASEQCEKKRTHSNRTFPTRTAASGWFRELFATILGEITAVL